MFHFRVATHMIGLASGFTKVSIADLLRWHFRLLRVVSTTKVVLAHIRVPRVHILVLQVLAADLLKDGPPSP